MRYKAGESLKVNYIVLHKTTGLTDVLMTVYDEAGIEFSGSPFTMTEVGNGLYYASFTPDAVGQWRIKLTSATNGDDISKIFEIQLTKLDDVKAQTQSIEDKITIIDANIDLIKIETDKIQTVDNNVDSIKSTGETTAGKVDTVITDIAAVKAVVDEINAQVNIGGYIL